MGLTTERGQLTLCVVCELEVLRSVVSVCEEAEAVDELRAAPLAVVRPVVELVGGAALVALRNNK